MRVSVTGLAKSGPCPASLNYELYHPNGRKKVGKQKPFSAGEAQNLGKILHDLVQHVITQPVDGRQDAIEQMVVWLNVSRKRKALVPEVREMIAPELLAGTHIDSMTQDISTIGRTLLRATNRLLIELEQEYNGSNGSWDVEMEKSIHDGNAYSHHFFEELTEIRGFIDLVFSWQNVAVLVELKTGAWTEASDGAWKRQIGSYMHVWRQQNPDVEVRGFVVQHSFDKGFVEVVDENHNPFTYFFEDETMEHPHDGCQHCSRRRFCSMYE